MSELAAPSPPENSPADAGDSVSAGVLLRQAREAAGLHIAALAVSLKVPVKKLEALESDRFDLLPDAVFVRALASSVCRTLKIDAAPILQRLPQTGRPRLTHPGTGINAPFRAPSDGPGPSIWAQISRPAVLAGLVLLLGALVLILLPAVKTGGNDAQPELAFRPVSNESADAVAAVVLAEAGREDMAKPPKIDSDIPLPAAASASAALPVQASRLPATPTVLVSPAPATVAPAAGSPTQALAAPAGAASAALVTPSTGIVVFSAKSESWVEVTDSKGLVVLRRTLNAGEVAGASGALPLAAVVGRADATQVQVRGKAFDLSAFARDNVARFEVK
ncbi:MULTISPECIES: helix-turn-helix domain-containing protein [Polaromonas]|uniref:Helix-turn-helix domain-containing protein n=1 Tax=Polaromonas aquatica TaxID=332657 RepID=A0ABW1TZ64_9BURK